MTLPASSIVLVVVAVFVGWRLYRRFKSLSGRQRLSPIRSGINAILFPAAIAFIAWTFPMKPDALAGLAVGLAAGIGLAFYSLSLTRFEAEGERFFYTPNPWFAIGFIALIAGRIAWRMTEAAQAGGTFAPRNPAVLFNAPTLALVGAIGGYYTAYAAGLLRWRYASARPNREG